MTADFIEVLDSALARLQTGESATTILADYPAYDQILDLYLRTATALETIRPVELPSSESLRADRTMFLSQIAALPRQDVTPDLGERLKLWFAHHLSWQVPDFTYLGKEHRRMGPLLIKLMLVFGVAFGSVGGTAVMAGNSLPDSPLYPIKLQLEQLRLALASDPAEQAGLHMVMVRERIREMSRLAAAGDTPDEAMVVQLQHHLNQALQLAAQAPDEVMQDLLNQIRQMTQTQTQTLVQVQVRVGEPADGPLHQAHRLMNQVRQEVEAGLEDPQAFRWRYGEGGQPEPPCSEQECELERNQNRHQNQHQLEHPADPCEGDDCGAEPEQEQERERNGSQTGAPGGPCSDVDCDQTQDQDRDRDRDRHGDQIPDQDLDQDRDRDRAGDQDQDRDRDRLQDPDPAHDRDRTRAQDQSVDQEQVRDTYRSWIQDRNETQGQGQNGAPADPGNENVGSDDETNGGSSGNQNSDNDAPESSPGSDGSGSANGGGSDGSSNGGGHSGGSGSSGSSSGGGNGGGKNQ